MSLIFSVILSALQWYQPHCDLLFSNDLKYQFRIKEKENLDLLIHNKKLIISVLDKRIATRRLQFENQKLINHLKSFSLALETKHVNQDPRTQQKNTHIKLEPDESPSLLSEQTFNQNDFIVLRDNLKDLINEQSSLNRKFESKFQQLTGYNERNNQDIREEILIHKKNIEKNIKELNEKREIQSVLTKEIREEIIINKKNIERNIKELNEQKEIQGVVNKEIREEIVINKKNIDDNFEKISDKRKGKLNLEFDKSKTQALVGENSKSTFYSNSMSSSVEQSQHEISNKKIKLKALTATLKPVKNQEREDNLNWNIVQHRKPKVYQTRFIIDSAAQNNMVNDKTLFIDFKHEPKIIKLANGTQVKSLGIGSIKLESTFGSITFQNTYFVPNSNINIISMATFLKKGYRLIPIRKNNFIIKGRAQNFLLTGTYKDGHLEIDQKKHNNQ